MEQNKLLELLADMESGSGADILSRAVFSSRGKLYRDFERHTGHTVNEFIRKRKLSKALAYIKSSELPLSYIAAECGYSSQQSMNRDVRSFTGYTPLQYRQSEIMHFFSPEIVDCKYNITVSTCILPEAKCLMYYDTSLRDIENKSLNEFYKLFPNYSNRLYGKNGRRDGGRHCYELYAQLDGEIYTGLFFRGEDRLITSSVFACLTVNNKLDEINAAWDYLYGRWLSSSMYEYSTEPYFEEYLRISGRISKLKLYLPIRKRQGYTNITIEKLPDMRFCVSSCSGRDAEKKASEKAISFLSDKYPYLLSMSREFYVKYTQGMYTCGIRIKNPLRFPEGGDIYEIKVEEGVYAVLHCGYDCDCSYFENSLTKWLEDNSFPHGSPFAVYDTTKGHEYPEVHIYCRINNGMI